jgi:hypothetical protein
VTRKVGSEFVGTTESGEIRRGICFDLLTGTWDYGRAGKVLSLFICLNAVLSLKSLSATS